MTEIIAKKDEKNRSEKKKNKFGINMVIKSFSRGDIARSKSSPVDKNLKIYEQYCDSAVVRAFCDINIYRIIYRVQYISRGLDNSKFFNLYLIIENFNFYIFLTFSRVEL